MAALLATPFSHLLLNPKPAFLLPTQFSYPRVTLSTHKPTTLQTRLRNRKPNATSIDAPAAAAEIVSATADSNGDATFTVISVLLFIAFLGLSILTIGVVYLGVTDFLQKREREKLEKEEASKKKKGGKKTRVRSRTGPRGFGQKIEDDED